MRCPHGMAVAPGDIVAVPLGTRDVVGVVWDDPPDEEIGHNRLRPIVGRYDAPPLPRDLRAFVDWVADYTLTPRGMVLRMVLRAPGALEPEPPIAGVRLAGPPPERMTPARQRVLAMLEGGVAWSRSGLAAAAAVGPGVVAGLVEAGTLEPVSMPPQPVARGARHRLRGAGAERRAAGGGGRPSPGVAAGGFSVTLLDGVTGSGKTEVYFEAVAEALDAGRQVLDAHPRDRADRRRSSSDSRARFGGAAGRMAFRSDAADARAGVARRGDGDRPGGGRRAFGAVPAVLANSASSSSTRSTTSPTSRRTASSTMPATWRWCAAISPASRSSSPRRRLRSNCRVNADAGPLPAHRAVRPLRRGEAARDRGDRHAASIRRSAAASCRRRWSRR